MRLRSEEPPAGPWHVVPLLTLVGSLLELREPATGRPVVVAVDGRSSSGKTTLARRLHAAVPGSAVVHTDDIAWSHSRFGWSDLLVVILGPIRDGAPVSFRPPAWIEHDRAGSIDVPAGITMLIVEGVGSGRRELGSLIDRMIWVQTDRAEIDRRNLARIGLPGESPTIERQNEWLAEEIPFIADQRPWERATDIVSGFPDLPYDPATQVVAT